MILQRLADWRREARIARLGDEIIHALQCGAPNYATALWHRRWAEIRARSPEQCRRMDARQRKAQPA
jgi:hypothetical protein